MLPLHIMEELNQTEERIEREPYDVIVIGAGAAGMMAAIQAASNGNSVTMLERNDRPGRKIVITGKGRCNVTNACETEELFGKIVTNKKYSNVAK